VTWRHVAEDSAERRVYIGPMPVSYDEALRVMGAVHERARQIGICVTAAVVDEGGLLQSLGRMDGAPPLSAQIAESKAVGAALWHRDGASLAQINQERPSFFQAVAQMVRVPIIPGLGSILIRRSGSVLGALGVSGGKPEQDLDCAEHGLRILAR
jgi:glc operon protein GlcG